MREMFTSEAEAEEKLPIPMHRLLILINVAWLNPSPFTVFFPFSNVSCTIVSRNLFGADVHEQHY